MKVGIVHHNKTAMPVLVKCLPQSIDRVTLLHALFDMCIQWEDLLLFFFSFSVFLL